MQRVEMNTAGGPEKHFVALRRFVCWRLVSGGLASALAALLFASVNDLQGCHTISGG
jgi:hypothetical protein